MSLMSPSQFLIIIFMFLADLSSSSLLSTKSCPPKSTAQQAQWTVSVLSPLFILNPVHQILSTKLHCPASSVDSVCSVSFITHLSYLPVHCPASSVDSLWTSSFLSTMPPVRRSARHNAPGGHSPGSHTHVPYEKPLRPDGHVPLSTTTPLVDITNLPFMKQYSLLSTLPPTAQGTVMNSIKRGPRDVDKWEISMSPDHYGKEFGSTLAVVRLSSHQPRVKSTKEGDRGHEFSDWLLLAECNYQLWVDMKYKDGFYKELKKWRTVQPAPLPWVSTYGNCHVPVPLLVHCLKSVHCPTIHLKSYGQKLPLVPGLVGTDPAELVHPLSHLNQWDIGVSYVSPYIFLFAPLMSTKKISLFPILVPSSGTMALFSGHQLQGDKYKMIQRMVNVPQEELGGYRIEVTVQASPLADARRMVDNVPFLELNFWRDPGGHAQELGMYKVDIKVTTRRGLVANANWMYQRAVDMGIFRGNAPSTPTNVHLRGITDLLASFGWNAGRRKPTKSNDPFAWWTGLEGTQWTKGGQHGDGPIAKDGLMFLSTLEHLNKKFKGKSGVQELVKILRTKSRLGYVPCPKGDKSGNHRLTVHGWKPMRFRWFAELVDRGHVSREAVGITAERPPVVKNVPPRPANRVKFGPSRVDMGDIRDHEDTLDNSLYVDQVMIRMVDIVKPKESGHELSCDPQLQPYKTLSNLSPHEVCPLSPVHPSVPTIYHTRWTAKDGNCMFTAFAKALNLSYITPWLVRTAAVTYIEQHSTEYVPFLPGGEAGVDKYLGDMSMLGTWGDNLTLQAMCSYFKDLVQDRGQGTESTCDMALSSPESL
ncbi:hypothetical protein TREMEDRAFT_66609 [Tremella mesenterica DSM 1558]|uniref:uncharacterized protein n=1 Tax=Tremella mesenterica (strain ATCC 24925 / CBS 8224 / DSM 1558 / NBRC 9311 / NRRL Y-6157 / RJB 2259-6 / UBC 559-6) TaxID=578456 RepID=UPI00032C23C2|nr:uncharacterized protein TREMEDRAFT_66609 [Tremella mesenterica DSM 1558]EIW65415.1 hypothetical protein TREMEDRAFT_66609 [Tremella mesenterica DSM 1558]